MNIYEIISRMNAGDIGKWAVLVLILVMSLIEVAPVRLNPWKATLGWLGKRLNVAIEDRLKDLESKLSNMWVNSHRNQIL